MRAFDSELLLEAQKVCIKRLCCVYGLVIMSHCAQDLGSWSVLAMLSAELTHVEQVASDVQFSPSGLITNRIVKTFEFSICNQ